MASSSSIPQSSQQKQENLESLKNQGPEEPKNSILHLWASSILILIIVVLGLGSLVIWVKVYPKRLLYKVDDAHVNDFFISPPVFNPKKNKTEDHLRATFFISFSSVNLNHMVTIRYEKVGVTIELDGQTLAFGAVEPFELPQRTNRSFNWSFSARNVALLLPVEKSLKTIKYPMEPIKVNVTMRATASFVVPRWKTEHRELKIVCRNVMAHSFNTTTFEKTDCYADL